MSEFGGRMQRCSCGFLPIPGATHCAKCGKRVESAAASPSRYRTIVADPPWPYKTVTPLRRRVVS